MSDDATPDVLSQLCSDVHDSTAFIVFLHPTEPETRLAELVDEVKSFGGLHVRAILDHDAALADFSVMFRDTPDVTKGVSAADMPEAVKAYADDRATLAAAVRHFEGEPGVKQVSHVSDSLLRRAALVCPNVDTGS